jgi:cell wall-associated NlpC family hydrolase
MARLGYTAVTAAFIAFVAAAPASASTISATTPVRACTNLKDTSCAGWTTLPAGATVTMRCWFDQAPAYAGTVRWFWVTGNGVQGFVSANRVSNQWKKAPGCASDRKIQAVRWAGSRLKENVYVGRCQAFVHDAWLFAGREIGGADTAYHYWQKNPKGYARAYDGKPPVGALVYWKPTPGFPEGHVAISIGSGRVVSTYERSTKPVHIFRIADRNKTHPYAGYLVAS